MTTALKTRPTLPSDLARTWYMKEGQPAGLDWEELLQLYRMSNSRVVVNEPNLFFLARPVKWSDKAGLAAEKAFRLEECDTWFVWMAIGDIRDISEHVPFSLPYVAWRSYDDVLHFYEFSRLKRIVRALYENGRKFPRPLKPCS